MMTRIEAKRLRELQESYRQDLHERVLRVVCPVCRAGRGKLCTHGNSGRLTRCLHSARHNEAKRLGLVKGKWFDPF